ncbi:MAG: hypothetical protein WC026_16755 [Hyphomicrobium sp.]|uniref:hypothetical protein n=1 Tax=Hyphomicrobium sp. TaxID=82 RepID=UPI0035617EF8
MAIIETKFSIGDVVYYASTTTERKQHPCPDCLGTKKWKAISPAGSEYEFRCPRCGSMYHSSHDLSLDYATFVPTASRLTIGSVRTDSADKTQYMCIETGVGSGTLYDEIRLFSTENEAIVAAQALANKSNDGGVPWVAQQYNKTLEVCDYQLNDGREHVEQKRADRLAWQIKDLRDEISNCEDMGDVASLVKSFE